MIYTIKIVKLYRPEQPTTIGYPPDGGIADYFSHYIYRPVDIGVYKFINRTLK